MGRASLAAVFLSALVLGALADDHEKCRGMDEGKLAPRNFEGYDQLSSQEFLKLLEGKWWVQSRINWFMRTWKCFSGDFVHDAERNVLTTNWSFRVLGPLPAVGFVDEIRVPEEGANHRLSLDSVSMPSWLMEKGRGVRVVDIAPRSADGGVDYIVLFDCGITVVPEGELFVLSRGPMSDGQLEDINRNAMANGIKELTRLPNTDC